MATYNIETAVSSDAPALAAADVHAEPDPFRQFMEGTADSAKKEAGMSKWWAQCIESSAHLVNVVRDERSGEVVSFAQWELPKEKAQTPPKLPDTEEVWHVIHDYPPGMLIGSVESSHIMYTPGLSLIATQEKAELRKKREAHVQPGQNGPLLLEWWSNLDILKTSFGTEPLYYLNSLRTLPEHRGKGLASKLVKRILDEADAKGIKVGLYTDGDGKAKQLYERLGFAEVGRFEIKLSDFGGEGRHLELAMVRNVPV